MATTFTNQATLSYNGATVRSNIATGAIESALTIDKQPLADLYSAGENLTYIISVINSGDNDITSLTVADDLGAYEFGDETLQPLSYVDGSVQYYLDGAIQPTPAVTAEQGVSFGNITVPANGNVLLIYQAQVNEFAPLGDGEAITNTATLTGGTICEAQASATVNAQSGAVLSMLKSVSPVPVSENGELSYTFRMANNGATALETTDNAVITDTFNPILSDLTVTLDGAPLVQGTDYTYNETTGEFSTVAGKLAVPAAAFVQDPTTGAWSVTPGEAVMVISGTVGSVCDITERS